MSTQPDFDKPVRIEEYLSNQYENACEYVDGIVEERDYGEFDPGAVQRILLNQFNHDGAAWKVDVVPAQRIRTQATHVRVPDVTVLRAGTPREAVLTHPALLVIEIMPPEIAISRAAQKAIEYLTFGIEHVWLIDPHNQEAYVGTSTGLEPVDSGEFSIPNTPIRLSTETIFTELERG